MFAFIIEIACREKRVNAEHEPQHDDPVEALLKEDEFADDGEEGEGVDDVEKRPVVTGFLKFREAASGESFKRVYQSEKHGESGINEPCRDGF